jgi:hypothetical protein
MTSVAARLGAATPPLDQARREVAALLARGLRYDEIRWVPAEAVRNLATGIETNTAAHPTAHQAA